MLTPAVINDVFYIAASSSELLQHYMSWYIGRRGNLEDPHIE